MNLTSLWNPVKLLYSTLAISVASVIDIIHNGIDIAILDASAICHLPDIIHSPYRCNIVNAYLPNEKNFTSTD